MKKLWQNENAFSLVEILLVVGLMGVMALMMINMQSNQMKANNHLEFQVKRVQLQSVVLGQILKDPNNCKCLFNGAGNFPTTPTAPGAGLTAPTPVNIGRYHFVTPGNCATATVPNPFIDSKGIDSLQVTSLKLTDIMNFSGTYSGNFVLSILSSKDMVSSPTYVMKVPVTISTTPGPAGMQTFESCSIDGSTQLVAACLGGCGGSWPVVIGAIAQYNWAKDDGTFYNARGANCANPLSWTGWNPGGACNDGNCRNANALFLCGQ